MIGQVATGCTRCYADTTHDRGASSVVVVGEFGTFRSKHRFCGHCTSMFYQQFLKQKELIEAAE